MKYVILTLLCVPFLGCELLSTTPDDPALVYPHWYPGSQSELLEVCCRITFLNERGIRYHRPHRLLLGLEGQLSLAAHHQVWLYNRSGNLLSDRELRKDCFLTRRTTDGFEYVCPLENKDRLLITVDENGEEKRVLHVKTSSYLTPAGYPSVHLQHAHDGGAILLYKATLPEGRRHLTRFSSTGEAVWSYSYPGADVEDYTEIGDDIITVGTPRLDGRIDAQGSVSRFDRNGISQRSRTIDCADGCRLTNIIPAGDDQFLAYGYYVGMRHDNVWASIRWVLLIDSDGDIIWDSRNWNQAPQGEPRLVKRDEDAHHILFVNPETTVHVNKLGEVLNFYPWPSQALLGCSLADVAERLNEEIIFLYGCQRISGFSGWFSGETWAALNIRR